MGNWKIVIEGTGCHHNKNYADDADRLAREIVQALLAGNHDVHSAQFSVLDGAGNEATGESLIPPVPECPCCHSAERVTVAPGGSRHRGQWFCPCNEPGPNPSGHFDTVPRPIADDKRWRLGIQKITDEMSASDRKSRSRSLAFTHLEDASMRLGKDLQELDVPNPYPSSRDPSSAKIEPSEPEACRV